MSPHLPGQCSVGFLRPLTDVLSGPLSLCEQDRKGKTVRVEGHNMRNTKAKKRHDMFQQLPIVRLIGKHSAGEKVWARASSERNSHQAEQS